MSATSILGEQVIYVKRGRSNSFGWEPCWNSYFDFYLDARYLGEPLLEFEDVTFHLYLRKNLNDKNPNWKMPTIRQISKKFGISNHKIYAMLARLEKAHLLNKESGVKEGEPTTRNDYILSDPIPTLNEFLEVAAEGLFGRPLMPCFDFRNTEADRVSEIETPGVSEIETPGVSEIETDQQTSSLQQTFEKQSVDSAFAEPRFSMPEKQSVDSAFAEPRFSMPEKQSVDPAFAELRASMPEKTFDQFLTGAKFLGVEDGVAVIGLLSGYAKDWIENRMANRIKQVFKAEAVRCVILTE